MRRFLQILKRNFRASSAFLVRYFLSMEKKCARDFVLPIFNGQLLKTGLFLLLDGDHDEERLYQLVSMDGLGPKNATIIIMRPEPQIFLPLTEELKNVAVITLIPNCLEEASPLLKALLSELSGTIVVFLLDISRLPCKKDQKLTAIFYDGNESYDLAFQGFFKELKYMHEKHALTIIALDHEAILGQKNSAFLRRIFKTQG